MHLISIRTYLIYTHKFYKLFLLFIFVEDVCQHDDDEKLMLQNYLNDQNQSKFKWRR